MGAGTHGPRGSEPRNTGSEGPLSRSNLLATSLWGKLEEKELLHAYYKCSGTIAWLQQPEETPSRRKKLVLLGLQPSPFQKKDAF